jgi:hypothetical protein
MHVQTIRNVINTFFVSGAALFATACATAQHANPSEPAPSNTVPAGDVAAPNAPTAAPEPPEPRASQVSFEAPQHDNDKLLTLHEVTGSTYAFATSTMGGKAWAEGHSFRELCAAPCVPNLSPGSYRLALSEGDGQPAIGNRVVIPSGPSTLHGTYVSHSGRRAAGFIIGLTSLLAGSAMMIAGAPLASKHFNDGLEAAGAGIAFVGLGVGSWMWMTKDEARFEVAPRTPALASW